MQERGKNFVFEKKILHGHYKWIKLAEIYGGAMTHPGYKWETAIHTTQQGHRWILNSGVDRAEKGLFAQG